VLIILFIIFTNKLKVRDLLNTHLFIFFLSKIMSGTTLNIRGNLLIQGQSEMSGVLRCKRIERPDEIDGKMTGEKFLGRNVYYKEWEGDLENSHIEGFFPSPSCCIVAFGGDHLTNSTGVERVPIPYPDFIVGVKIVDVDLIFEALHDQSLTSGLRFWVKYTDDEETENDNNGDDGISIEEENTELSGSSSSSSTGSGSGSGSGAGEGEVIAVETPYP
jgi:hypothetical protein